VSLRRIAGRLDDEAIEDLKIELIDSQRLATDEQGTLAGIELMHMIKKKQMMVKAGDEDRTAAELFYSLAA